MNSTQHETTLTPKQEAAFVYHQEQDLDWWPVLLCQHLCSRGDTLAALKASILGDSGEWELAVAQAKAGGLGAVRKLASEKAAQWGSRVKLLLADPIHVQLLELYLKSVVLLKSKRVADVGGRAQTRQQVNTILAGIANKALTGLDRFVKASAYQSSGITAGGRVLTPEAHTFYETMYKENAALVTNLLAVVFLLREAQCAADIRQLQDYIKINLIKPLEIKTGMLMDTTSPDYKSQREKVWLYQKLLRMVEISFE